MCAKNLKLVRILDCGDPRAQTIERGLELLAMSRPASTSAFCPGQRAGCSTRAGRAEISQAGKWLVVVPPQRQAMHGPHRDASPGPRSGGAVSNHGIGNLNAALGVCVGLCAARD